VHNSRSRSSVGIRAKQSIQRIKRVIDSPIETRKGSFFGSALFGCGDMMNVLNEKQRKVCSQNIHSDKNLPYKDHLIPVDSFYSESDGDVSSRRNYAHDGENIENNAYYEQTQMPDEYTCVTQPTHNKYQGAKVMREDKARNMIHKYANRVGVHPTKMV